MLDHSQIHFQKFMKKEKKFPLWKFVMALSVSAGWFYYFEHWFWWQFLSKWKSVKTVNCRLKTFNIKTFLSMLSNSVDKLNAQMWTLGLIHTVRFFLIATAIPLITTNGLHRTQWKCSHYAIVTTSLTPIQPIMRKDKSLSQIAQCERPLLRE